MVGTSGPQTRAIGPSRYSNASSATRAAISAPIPPVTLSSWAIRSLPVLRTEERIVSLSRGERVRKSHNFNVDPFGAYLICRLETVVQGQAVADHGDVAAGPLYVGLTDGQGVLAFRHFAAHQAVGLFVLQEHDRVVVADSALEQALGVVGRARRYHLEARRVEKVSLYVL